MSTKNCQNIESNGITSDIPGDEDKGWTDDAQRGWERVLKILSNLWMMSTEVEIGDLDDPSNVSLHREELSWHGFPQSATALVDRITSCARSVENAVE